MMGEYVHFQNVNHDTDKKSLYLKTTLGLGCDPMNVSFQQWCLLLILHTVKVALGGTYPSTY